MSLNVFDSSSDDSDVGDDLHHETTVSLVRGIFDHVSLVPVTALLHRTDTLNTTSTAAESTALVKAIQVCESCYSKGSWTDADSLEKFNAILTTLSEGDGRTAWQLASVLAVQVPRMLRFEEPLDGMIYCIGGRSSPKGFLKSCEMFDSFRNEWRRLPDLPEPRVGAAAACVNGRIYVVGGYSLDITDTLSSVLYLDPLDPESEWRRLPDMQHPRFGHGMAAVGGRIYVVGGNDQGHLTTSVEIFDTTSTPPSWTNGPPLHRPIAGARVAADPSGQRLFLVGGCSQNHEALDIVQVLDLCTMTWKISDEFKLSKPRAACGVTFIGPALMTV